MLIYALIFRNLSVLQKNLVSSVFLYRDTAHNQIVKLKEARTRVFSIVSVNTFVTLQLCVKDAKKCFLQ